MIVNSKPARKGGGPTIVTKITDITRLLTNIMKLEQTSRKGALRTKINKNNRNNKILNKSNETCANEQEGGPYETTKITEITILLTAK